MPQLQYNYDYNEYERARSNRASKSRSTTTSGRSVSRNVKNTSAKRETISNSVREANRASIRSAINSDDELFVRRAPATKSRSSVVTQTTVKTDNAGTKKTVQKNNTSISNKTVNNKTSNKTVKKNNVSVTSKTVKKNNTSVAKQTVKNKKIEKPKEMSLKNAEVMIDAETKAKIKEEKKHNVFKNISYSLCAFSILFLICYRSSYINESFKSVNKMKAELETIQTTNAQIESEIQTQTDLSNIETYAKYQLGMQKPKESQIRKVVTQKEDKISTPVVIAEEEETSFWKNLLNDLMNIID